MATPAGKLRELVVLQQRNLVDNGRGGRSRPSGQPEWINADGASMRAEIIPLRGDEALQNVVLRSMQTYRVTVRWRADVTTDQRLLWGTLALDIKSAARSPDRRDLVMTCESGVPI